MTLPHFYFGDSFLAYKNVDFDLKVHDKEAKEIGEIIAFLLVKYNFRLGFENHFKFITEEHFNNKFTGSLSFLN
jgi:hypothetical protein